MFSLFINKSTFIPILKCSGARHYHIALKRCPTWPSIRKALADTKGLPLRTQASLTRYRVGTLSEQSATMSYIKAQGVKNANTGNQNNTENIR